MTPNQIASVRRLARRYRANAALNHPQRGVVLIWRGSHYGWKDCLRDPQHERPGALAVDTENRVYEARGGNDHDGAREWVEVTA